MSYVLFLCFLFLPDIDTVDSDFLSCTATNCSMILYELLILYPDNHYCAFYDFKDELLLALLNEHTLIFDEEYEENLHSRFTPVSSRGLMHHKFCVFDNKLILTGSWNPTTRGTNFNDNYILLLRSQNIAQQYLDMYTYLLDRTMTFSPLDLQTSHGSYSVYTCPLHDCQEMVLHELKQATSSVRILAFTFTDQDIAEELLYLSRNGVDVEVIFEKTRITRYSAFHDLKYSNVDVYYDGNSFTMHQKMILIDESTVILGSYNPTKSATLRNDENIVVIQDLAIAQKSLLEYHRIREEALKVDIYK